MDDEEAKRIQEERDKELTEEYKELQNPKAPEEKQSWNPVNVIQEAFGDIKESGEVWDEGRQEFLTKKVAPFAQKVDDSLTNVTKQNWVGDRARNVINFGADVLAPTSGDLAVGAAVLPLTAADGPLPFGDAAAGTIAGLKYGQGVTSRIYQKTIPNLSAKLDDWLSNPLFSRANRAVTPEGVELSPTHMMSKGYNPNQTELPLEPFMSNTYQRNVISKMNRFGMGNGVFRMKTYNSYLNKGNAGRDMLESYLSPDRLKGSFQGYKKFNKKSVEYKWGAFLEKKGYNLAEGIQVHHINPLYDSIHLFDNVKFNSKEYWSLMDILIKKNARTGAIQKGDNINNLMMTLGRATDETTPHGIAHKFYNNFTSTFFSPAEMKKMNTVKGYRNKKAKRWATLVNKSEEIILEAHKQWSLLNPVTAQNLSFDELVERLSNLDARGYNKLMDPKYQLPDMNSIIKEIAADKKLKGPIFKTTKKVVDPSKITQLEQMTKEGDIINELKILNKKPKIVDPNQGKFPGL